MSAAPDPDDRELPRLQRLVWVLVAAVSILFGGSVVAVWLAESVEPVPTFSVAARGTTDRATQRGQQRLHIAGSGSNIPMTKALLAARYGHRHDRVVVHPSIGTGGGVRALRDGAVDVAMISRPLDPEEAEALVVIPWARVPVVVAVHPSVPVAGLATAELIEIYGGQRTTWSDGTPVVVLQRERGDSSHRAFDVRVPGFREVNEAAYQARRFRVLYHDVAMLDALESVEGAIGLVGSGVVPDASYRVLALDGRMPTPETVASGEYPFTKDLAFAMRGVPTGLARDFMTFIHGDEARRVVRAFGSVSLPEER